MTEIEAKTITKEDRKLLWITYGTKREAYRHFVKRLKATPFIKAQSLLAEAIEKRKNEIEAFKVSID